MPKQGSDFEILAESVFKKISDNPNNIIKRNIRVDGTDGKREIDILVETPMFGYNIMTIIECKDWNKKIAIDKFEGFVAKMKDVKANKGIFISGKGFSKQVLGCAKRNGIECYTIQQANHPKFNINVSIPCLIEKITDIALNINFIGEFKKGDKINGGIINNINIYQTFLHNYMQGKYDDLLFTDILAHEINISNILENTPIYFVDNGYGEKRTIENITIKMNIQKKYSVIYLNELEHTQLIQDLLNNKNTVILDINEIFNNISEESIRFYNNKEDLSINGELNLFVKLSPDLIHFNRITNSSAKFLHS